MRGSYVRPSMTAKACIMSLPRALMLYRSSHGLLLPTSFTSQRRINRVGAAVDREVSRSLLPPIIIPYFLTLIFLKKSNSSPNPRIVGRPSPEEVKQRPWFKPMEADPREALPPLPPCWVGKVPSDSIGLRRTPQR